MERLVRGLRRQGRASLSLSTLLSLALADFCSTPSVLYPNMKHVEGFQVVLIGLLESGRSCYRSTPCFGLGDGGDGGKKMGWR